MAATLPTDPPDMSLASATGVVTAQHDLVFCGFGEVSPETDEGDIIRERREYAARLNALADAWCIAGQTGALIGQRLPLEEPAEPAEQDRLLYNIAVAWIRARDADREEDA